MARGQQDDKNLADAVDYILSGKPGTFKEVVVMFGVSSTTTLHRYVKRKRQGLAVKRCGGQTVFSIEQERIFERHLSICASAGWGLIVSEVQDYIQRFCQLYNLPVARFNNQRPGRDWVAGFLHRHPELTNKRCKAVSNAKAYGLNEEGLRDFFKAISDVLCPDGHRYCAPKDVVNYDETQLANDQGSKGWHIVLRRSRTRQFVMDTRKGGTSCMFAVTADGTLLPPYLCSKTQPIAREARDPFPSAVYGSSPTGWFTMNVFEDWFEKVIVPWAEAPERGLNRVIVGDNLSSHFSPKVMELAGKHGVSFRLLPPNCTHYLQPLDVAVFRSLKNHWRDLSREHLATTGKSSLAKKDIPQVLRLAMEKVKPETILNGFQASGLVPFDVEQALTRMPFTVPVRDGDGAVLTNYIKGTRKGRHEEAAERRRKRPAPGVEMAVTPAAAAAPAAPADTQPPPSPPPPPPPTSSNDPYETESDNIGEDVPPTPPPTPPQPAKKKKTAGRPRIKAVTRKQQQNQRDYEQRKQRRAAEKKAACQAGH